MMSPNGWVSVVVCFQTKLLKPTCSAASNLSAGTSCVGDRCSLPVASQVGSAYISEVCPWPKINVVNTALQINKFPGAATTPRPVINKLIHGIIHSLKCSQPPFIPRIYVCCYFSESAERNQARGEINHISHFNLSSQARVIRAHFHPFKHRRRQAAKSDKRGRSSIFLLKPVREGRWLSPLPTQFSVTMVKKERFVPTLGISSRGSIFHHCFLLS